MKLKTGPTLKLIATTGLGLLLVGAPQIQAEEGGDKSALRRFFEQDYLLGDWGGLRTELREEHGVDFEFMYAASVPSAIDGGLDEGSVYQGALLMVMNVDTEKLGLWADGGFRASSLYMHSGDRFSPNYVGDLNQVSMLDFPDSFRLWELFYEHKFLDGKVSLKAGQLDIGLDFLVPEYYNSIGQVSFLNQTFFFPTMAFNVYDQPGFPVGFHGLASTPYASPGARLRVDFTPKVYAQVGGYDGNPDRSFSGTDFHLDGEEGALLYFELGYKNNQGESDTGLPGNFKVGGWYHTDEFFKAYDSYAWAFNNQSALLIEANYPGMFPPGTMLTDLLAGSSIPFPSGWIAPSEQSGNYGLYFLVDHTLWREQGAEDPARQGLVGFFRASWAPPDRNLAEYGLDGGLVYKGLIPSRDWDTLGIAFSYLRISDDLRDAQDDLRAYLNLLDPGAGAVVPEADYEAVLEINYKFQMAAWWAVNLSAQRVCHPGGNVAAKVDDAWAFIVQTTLRF